MKIATVFLLVVTSLFGSFSSFGQAGDTKIKPEQLVGYYDVGVKPNRPFFKSRWYMKAGKLFCIYDSDRDREVTLYENGKLNSTIFFEEANVPQIEGDSNYYLIINMEAGKMKSFKVKRPRSDWPTDLYAYRNDKLDRLAVNTEASLTNHKHTDHFSIFYSDKDQKFISSLTQVLEERYSSILEAFNIDSLAKTTVRIYPELSTYHNAVLTPGAPSWQMGRVWDANEIRMLSPNTAQELNQEIMETSEMVLHEFIHSVHLNLISDGTRVPGWFWEGLALYKGCCKWLESPYELGYMKKKKYPSLNQIINDRSQELKYDLGYYLIGYIDTQFGWDKVLELIKTNVDLKSTLGMTPKQFEKGFYAFLEEEY